MYIPLKMAARIAMWISLLMLIGTDADSSTDPQSGDSNESEQAASIDSLYMFPDFLDFQNAPIQSDSSGLDESEFHNFQGKFLIIPEDEEANILENTFDAKHRIEDPHLRSQVTYTADGTKVVQYEPNEKSAKTNGSEANNANDSSGDGNSFAPKTVENSDPLKQGLQVSFAPDGTKIIQHAPTALPPNKYNMTTPVPGPKPTISIHNGIKYPKPNTTKSLYFIQDGTRITQFNTGVKDNNGTMKPKWAFIPEEYVPGFSDDDNQPNAAGYKYRNRAGEQEKVKLIKEQMNEASKEHNPTYQFKTEEDLVNSLAKPSNNGSSPRTVQGEETLSQSFTNNGPSQIQDGSGMASILPSDTVANKSVRFHKIRKQGALKTSKTKHFIGKPAKVVHTFLYDVRPLKPNQYKPVENTHQIGTGSKRGEQRYSKKMQGILKGRSTKSKLKRKKKKHGKIGKKNKAASRLNIMPVPDARNETKKEVGNSESGYRQALHSLVFKNEPGVVRKKQNFAYVSQCGLYTEPQNISQVQHAWATKTYSPYFYLYEKPKNYEQCKPSPWMNNTDMRGNVFISFEVKSIHGSNMENNAKICQKYCCKEPRCAAWVMRKQSAATTNCPKDSFCCWLKTAVPKREPNEDATSGVVQRERYRHPPTGMRSAVPLGGLGTGSFELRADGTFHEWTIENQSPGGAAKLSKTALDLMLLAVRIEQKDNHKSAVLRTHAPRGFDGVEQLSYYGSFPVSRLDFELQPINEIKMSLYAHSSMKPRDPIASSVPAVTFSLNIENPTDEDVAVSFMLNLPLGYNDDTIRRGGNYAEVAYTRLVTPADCMEACAKQSKCMSWTTNGPFSCLLKDSMPLNSYEFGIISGLKGHWTRVNNTLTHKRPGFYAQSGETSLRVLGSDNDEVHFITTNHPEKIWKTFKKNGHFGNGTLVNATALHGTAAVKARIPAKKSRTLTIILSWYYPNRDIADERVGNYYSNIFKSSEDVASYVESHMTDIVHDIVKFQSSIVPPRSMFFKDKIAHQSCDPVINGVNMLPECLQDILMNSLSYWRSGMWMENGRWRQWEAFDCVNFDPVHVDFHRFIPYVIFYPELAKNVMRAWAEHQLISGMIQESLSQGCLEETSKDGVGGGRSMTDVNVAFVVQTYLIYMWTNDTKFFDDMYPVASRALTWLIKEAAHGTDLPYRKPDTYDLFELDKYDHCVYNSILAKLALRAGEEMAFLKNDFAKLEEIGKAYDRAHLRLEVEMWDDKDGFYHAWFDAEWGSPSWIMSDSFYGQVWAYTLGLGDLVDKHKLKSHLLKERERNDTPFGLKAISKSESKKVIQEDTSVILGEEPGCKSLENITKYESIWMTASTDWSTLMLNLDMPPRIALHQAEKSLDHYRSTLKDQWNFHGLTSSENYGLDGLPWATSHYSFQLMLWHLPLSLSGQQYNAPNATLTFKPKFDVPYWLSFYTPVALGNIEAKFNEASNETMFKFTVSSGQIYIKNLSISGSRYGRTNFEVLEGESVEWSVPSKKSDSNKEVEELLAELKR